MRARLTVDLDAIAANWRALAALAPSAEAGAVVKADGYGLGAAKVGPALAAAGVKSFFVALVEEGVALRAALGPAPRIFVFGGMAAADGALIRAANLIPLLNSPGQLADAKALAATAGEALTVGLQLDSGMNRLGFEPAELRAALDDPQALDGLRLALVMSHLACADEPEHPQNAQQLAAFREMTAHPALAGVPRSLSATGGALLGKDYAFDLVRPGIGLYGGLPFAAGRPVVTLEAPIIQVRDVAPGESVGYGAAYRADRPRKIATVSLGYADGFHRALSRGYAARLGGRALPSAGRVSMDLVTLDVTEAPEACAGAFVALLDAEQGVDALAEIAGTIGYEILTSLGARYERRYSGG